MKIRIALLRRIFYVSLTLGLLVAVVSIFYLRAQIQYIGTDTETGPIWVVTNTERDLQKFELELMEYLLSQSTAAEVNLKFDILWSRVTTLEVGKAKHTFEEFEVDTSVIGKIRQYLLDSEETIIAIDNATPEEISVVLHRYFAFNKDLRQLTLDVLAADGIKKDEWREELLNISKTHFNVAILAIFCVVLLFGLFSAEQIQSRRRLAELRVLLQNAEAANVAKSQFISIMNHELRTPLTSISGAIELLNNNVLGEMSEKAKSVINLANRNCKQLMSLINEILDAEKFAAGRMEYSFTTIQLSEFLYEQVKVNGPYSDKFGINLELLEVPPNTLCEMDIKRMAQVMANLLSNAIKFSESGSTVTVAASVLNTSVTITVKDHGRGIPDAALEKLFHQFEQVDSSDERERGGTGLGLYIVRSIVEGHGGRVEVKSKIGEGSTFSVIMDCLSVSA